MDSPHRNNSDSYFGSPTGTRTRTHRWFKHPAYAILLWGQTLFYRTRIHGTLYRAIPWPFMGIRHFKTLLATFREWLFPVSPALATMLIGTQYFLHNLVALEGLEPPRLAALVPKTSVSCQFHHRAKLSPSSK
jgi:hypothetical protein